MTRRHYAQLAASTEQADARLREAEAGTASEAAEADRLREALLEAEARVRSLEQASAQAKPPATAEAPRSAEDTAASPRARRPGWAFWRNR